MSGKTEKSLSVNRKATQIIVDFDAESLKAPFLLRCGALLIDYMILIGIPAVSLLIGRFSGYDGAKLLNNPINNVSWLIMLLMALTNFLIIPMFSGQSIGKMFTGLRIVKMDGNPPGFTNLIRRNLLGYAITLLTGFLGFIFSVFNSKGRALHDYLGGTTVIYGERIPKALKN